MNSQSIYKINNIKLDNDSLLLHETLFHNANGYIGVRSAFEEGYPEEYKTIRGQYINGLYDFVQVKQAERLYGLVEEKQTMLNVADTQHIKLYLGDEAFTMFEGTVLKSRRWIDMDKGITGRYVYWRSPGGKEAEITIVRMASFHQLSLFTIEYIIQPVNFSGEVKIESTHSGRVSNFFDPNDPRTASEKSQYLTPVSCEISSGVSLITARTSKSDLEVCSCVGHVLPTKCAYEYAVGKDSAQLNITASVQNNEVLRVVKYAVFADSLRNADVKSHAAAEMKKALSVSLQQLYAYQQAYLSQYWENAYVEIEGDALLNTAMRYNLFSLLQSASKDAYGNIAPKGLSGEGYEGHYFWDSEMYIHPFFTITNPQVTKQLITYRYETLASAKENARILGHKEGVLYPWRTIMGKECSGFFPAGSAQYHINGAIAYTVIAYYLATKDEAFLLEKGAEIVFETARLWIDVGCFYKGEFHINGVTGPDEYTCIVDNNYYTNVLAQYHLRWAVKLYEQFKAHPAFSRLRQKIALRQEEIDEFAHAARHMRLPYDEILGINPQDDSFLQKKHWDPRTIPRDKFPLLLHYHPLHLYRHQICKQPDTLLAHFILEDAQPLDTIRKSFDYYEAITTHDSSLSRCIFSIVAAKLGMDDKAFSYFGDSAQLDLLDLQKNTKDGIHTASMGGSYMAIVYGFGGFRLKEQGISFAPMLPDKWLGYRFRIRYEDSRILVDVRKDRCMFVLQNGRSKQITVYGKPYTLEDEICVYRERGK